MAAAKNLDAELAPPRPARHDCEVLVVGGGPSGASAAYWLANAGVDVVALEKKHYPRVKTCGDGLTPRSVRQLEDMGLGDDLARHHRYRGLRANAFGRTISMDWPDHPTLPGYGYVITRADLDGLVAERAEKAGARSGRARRPSRPSPPRRRAPPAPRRSAGAPRFAAPAARSCSTATGARRPRCTRST